MGRAFWPTVGKLGFYSVWWEHLEGEVTAGTRVREVDEFRISLEAEPKGFADRLEEGVLGEKRNRGCLLEFSMRS